ncbi:hypothetical protein BHE74_00024609, partial [Ensete ventricosum]
YKNFSVWLQGGMSNELYNTIARVTDGIYEGAVCFLDVKCNFQALQLEEMFSLVQLFLITCCGLTTSLR